MVANLAKSWQGWANEHADKQDAIPSGWMPSSIVEEDKKERGRVVRLGLAPRVVTAGEAEAGGSKIRTCSVTKTVGPKRSECGSGSDVVNAIKGKIESGPDESRPFLGAESPTRRRQMRALQSLQDRKLMLQEKTLGSRSSSVETEDSGLGEEAGLSDNSEPKAEPGDVKAKKHSSRPKVERFVKKNVY